MVSIGQHFVTTRVVHLPKRTETSLITESDQSGPNHQLLQLCTATQPGPSRTRLCGLFIAAKAGCYKDLESIAINTTKYCSFSGFTAIKSLGNG